MHNPFDKFICYNGASPRREDRDDKIQRDNIIHHPNQMGGYGKIDRCEGAFRQNTCDEVNDADNQGNQQIDEQYDDIRYH